MPAKNFTKSDTCFWYEQSDLSSGVLTQHSTPVAVKSISQQGSFPLVKPKPLPPSTQYSTTQMRAMSASRHTQTVLTRNKVDSRRYIGYPTALLYDGGAPVHDLGRYNEALASLRSTVLDGKWEGGVFLGELKETMHIFSSGAKVLTDFLSSIRKTKKGQIVGTWQGKSHIADNMSSMWLFVRYGVIPLMSDIHDSLEVLGKKLSIYDKRCFAKSPKKKSVSIKRVDLKPGNVVVTSVTRIWFKAWFDPPASYSALVKRFMDQLGLMNPTQVLWELLTLSFVVDWFIDIGGYLEALGSPSGFKIYQVETNMLTIENTVIDPNGTFVNTLRDTVIFAGERTQRDYMVYNRSLGGWPYPIAPSFDPEMTVKRVVDAMALMKVLSRRALK